MSKQAKLSPAQAIAFNICAFVEYAENVKRTLDNDCNYSALDVAQTFTHYAALIARDAAQDPSALTVLAITDAIFAREQVRIDTARKYKRERTRRA